MRINQLKKILIEDGAEVWRGGRVPSSFFKRNVGTEEIAKEFREKFSNIFDNNAQVLCWLLSGTKIKKCPICGKRIPYVKLKQGRDAKFCSEECMFSENGKKELHRLSVESILNSTGGLYTNNFQVYKDECCQKGKESKFNNLLEKIKEKMHKADLEFVDDFSSFIDDQGNRRRLKIRCKKCGTVFGRVLRKSCNYNMLCPKCNRLRLSWSGGERELGEFVIGELGEDLVVLNDKRIIKKGELDIYIPSLKLAIEYNGLYWHSDMNGKDENYHINKTKKCNALGIKLIHIFEDEWNYKKRIVKNYLKRILGNGTVIPSDKCKVVEVDGELSAKFHEKYNIFGSCVSDKNIGLRYKGRLIFLASFDNCVIKRVSSIGSYDVSGGLKKVLEYFGNKSITVYDDIRWSDGREYVSLGFNVVDILRPRYYWFHKDKGIREGSCEPKNLKGYGRVWDCGAMELRRGDE